MKEQIKKIMWKNSGTRAIYCGLKSIKYEGLRATLKKLASKSNDKSDVLSYSFLEPLTPNDIENQRNYSFKEKVKFSIVVPLYNTKEKFLLELLESVVRQTYDNWELCLANASDRYNNVEKILRKYMEKYPNIKYKAIGNNKGIALNTVEAYDLATGDYVVLMDHDDFLTQDALFELAKCINQDDTVDFIYSDRGIFSDATRELLAYHYLPAYSPEFLRGCNYASHLNAFSKYIIDEVGFLKDGYNGSQDYEFELRVVEKARKIVNIPKVLYYCRACEGSVALDPSSKMYAYEAGRQAIEEHISRIGYPGQVDFVPETFSYRIHYNISSFDKVSIIIPSKDHAKDLKRCVYSILDETNYINYEIIIVDDESVEEQTIKFYEEIEKIDKVKILRYKKKEPGFNFSAINNFAVQETAGKYILFLNNDTEVINPKWITEMVMFAQRDDVGAVGAKLYYPNDTYQHAGLFIGLGGHVASYYDHMKSRYEMGYMNRLSMPQNYNAVTAACMMIKREDFLRVEGFDEQSFKVGLNDVDLCLKLRAIDKINVVTPYAELYHYESASRGSDIEGENKVRLDGEIATFKEKWAKYYQTYDEYTNPNFTI